MSCGYGLRSHGLVVEWLLAEQDDLGSIPAVLVFFSIIGCKLVRKNIELAKITLFCSSPLRE